MKVSIDDIKIKEGRRKPDAGHVEELADSIRELGLLNPITINKRKSLIAGLHRLEAARLLGWTEVECVVSSLEGLKAELAEIDENFVRNDLPALEYGEMLLRRKEIYETLHPETRNGGDRRSEKTRSAKCTSDSAKSFVEDTAEKLGVNPCTVRRQIQTAKNLTPETKEIIRESDAKLSKKTALKLSRLEPERQKEAASLLAAKEIKSVDEYDRMAAETGKPEARDKEDKKGGRAAPEEMDEKGVPEEKTAGKGTEEEPPTERAETERKQKNAPEGYGPESAGTGGSAREEPEREAKGEPGQEPDGKAGKKNRKEPPDKIGESISGQTGRDGESEGNAYDSGRPAVKGEVSFKEIVADLKNMDKDCSGTPASFLAEFGAFVGKFRREIEWYDNPYFDPVFMRMSEREFADFRGQADSIHAAVDRLFEKIERMMKDGK